MASPHLTPKPPSSILPHPPPPLFAASHRLPSPLRPQKPTLTTILHAKKKNPWLDPFDDGPDTDMDYNGLYAGGKQDESPLPEANPDNPYGFLKFPMGYNVELAGLASKLRGDVRRCCCVVSGGVYENLLFFPVVQMLKDRYPGVQVDIITSERGKQTYELNKNVRWADAYDPDEDFPEPAVYTDMIGIIRNRYYDMILSTKLAGMGHAAFLFMSTARDRVSYVYPNVNAAGAGLFLSETFTPEGLNLSDGGYNMYYEMLAWLGRPGRNLERTRVPPLKVSISKKLKEYVEAKYTKAGVEKGRYVVVHGIKSDSIASMRSKGDTDSLLPVEIWAELAKEIRGVKPLFIIPHDKERDDLEEAAGEDSAILRITTPGQLAAVINDSLGVISTNTAALQLAIARDKPSIALFSSEEKAKVFAPKAIQKRCVVISSNTGKLIDIDREAVKKAIQIFKEVPVFAY